MVGQKLGVKKEWRHSNVLRDLDDRSLIGKVTTKHKDLAPFALERDCRNAVLLCFLTEFI